MSCAECWRHGETGSCNGDQLVHEPARAHAAGHGDLYRPLVRNRHQETQGELRPIRVGVQRPEEQGDAHLSPAFGGQRECETQPGSHEAHPCRESRGGTAGELESDFGHGHFGDGVRAPAFLHLFWTLEEMLFPGNGQGY